MNYNELLENVLDDLRDELTKGYADTPSCRERVGYEMADAAFNNLTDAQVVEIVASDAVLQRWHYVQVNGSESVTVIEICKSALCERLISDVVAVALFPNQS